MLASGRSVVWLRLANHEDKYRSGNRKLAPTTMREAVPVMLAPQQTTSFQPTKQGKNRAVARSPRERSRMRVSLDQMQDERFRHASG
jgi:hypothetical protein